MNNLPNLSKTQLILIKNFLEKYEDFLFQRYGLHRDKEFRPYYYDDFLNKIIDSDNLVQEVVNLDELLSTLNSVSIK